MRRILVRFAIPALLAVSILAFIVVPFADRMLGEWFRADVNMRARLVANSMASSLGTLIDDAQPRALQSYLSGITADERLMAVILCRADGALIFQSERTPDDVSCASVHKLPNDGGKMLQLPPQGRLKSPPSRTPRLQELDFN